MSATTIRSFTIIGAIAYATYCGLLVFLAPKSSILWLQIFFGFAQIFCLFFIIIKAKAQDPFWIYQKAIPSTACTLFQCLFGVIASFFPFNFPNFIIAINILFIAISIILSITITETAKHGADVDKKIINKTFSTKKIVSSLKLISTKTKNNSVERSQISRLIELAKYNNLVTYSETREIESEILALIQSLERDPGNTDLYPQLETLLQKRTIEQENR